MLRLDQLLEQSLDKLKEKIAGFNRTQGEIVSDDQYETINRITNDLDDKLVSAYLNSAPALNIDTLQKVNLAVHQAFSEVSNDTYQTMSMKDRRDIAMQSSVVKNWVKLAFGFAVTEVFDDEGNIKESIANILLSAGLSEDNIKNNAFKMAFLNGFLCNILSDPNRLSSSIPKIELTDQQSRCDLVVVKRDILDEKDIEALKKIQSKNMHAYVFVANRLFYVDKTRNSITELNGALNNLSSLHDNLSKDQNYYELNDAQISKITMITEHSPSYLSENTLSTPVLLGDLISSKFDAVKYREIDNQFVKDYRHNAPSASVSQPIVTEKVIPSDSKVVPDASVTRNKAHSNSATNAEEETKPNDVTPVAVTPLKSTPANNSKQSNNLRNGLIIAGVILIGAAIMLSIILTGGGALPFWAAITLLAFGAAHVIAGSTAAGVIAVKNNREEEKKSGSSTILFGGFMNLRGGHAQSPAPISKTTETPATDPTATPNIGNDHTSTKRPGK